VRHAIDRDRSRSLKDDVVAVEVELDDGGKQY
jgi:hypothetical protein